MKIFILIFISSYFIESNEVSARKILSFLFFLAIPIFLILREPDLGTTLSILFVALVVLIALRAPKKFLLGGVILIFVASPIVWAKLKPYQKERIVSFANPSSNPLTSGYNVNQAKIAVGSGGLLGKGFSGSTQSQLQFLPIAHIDFIFSGWAEATGFVGSSMLVIAFAVLIWRIFTVANLARENFGFVFGVGAAALIFFQALVNIGMNIGIMPVTGIPLPFVSYGGTSFLIDSAILGIVQSIYLRRKALRFD
jgi:rod shape determining protein RodA